MACYGSADEIVQPVLLKTVAGMCALSSTVTASVSCQALVTYEASAMPKKALDGMLF